MSSSSLARFTPGRRPAALARRSMECYPSDPDATASSLLAGKTLVLPVVSHGNVGQLASDLAIEALRLPRVAILDHAALLPCVGAGAFTADAEPPATHLALGFELRACASRAPGFALAQQRALVAPGAGRAFANDLAAFVARCAPRECVLLASVPSTRANVDPERPGPGAPIGAVAFRSVCVGPDAEARRARLRADAGVEALLEEDADHHHLPDANANANANGTASESPFASRAPPWPLLAALAERGVPATCVVAVCSEGDNTEDAVAMANLARKLWPEMFRSLKGSTTGEGEGPGRDDAFAFAPPPSWAAAYGQTPARREMFA